MEQNNKENKKWATPEEYEDSVFDKVMQIYIKKQGKEILDELSDEDDDKSDLDLDYINKLMGNTK